MPKLKPQYTFGKPGRRLTRPILKHLYSRLDGVKPTGTLALSIDEAEALLEAAAWATADWYLGLDDDEPPVSAV